MHFTFSYTSNVAELAHAQASGCFRGEGGLESHYWWRTGRYVASVGSGGMGTKEEEEVEEDSSSSKEEEHTGEEDYVVPSCFIN